MSSELEAKPVPLSERLNDPEVANALNRLIDRAGQLDRMADQLGQVTENAPNLLATLVDLADSVSRSASQQGIDLEERGKGLLQLLVQFTNPATLEAANRLVAELPVLAKAAQEAPNLLAIVMDVLDEFTQKLKTEDIDVEKSLRQGLHAALWLGERISETELDRLGTLLRSDVLDENAVETVAMAGTALAKCQDGSCDLDAPQRVGVFGLLAALRDPNVQRFAGFALRFSKCFGNSLNDKQTK